MANCGSWKAGEVVYPGEHALLAAPTLAQPSSPPPNAASFDVAGRLSIDRSRKEDAAEALRTWLSSPAKPRGDVPDLVGSDLAKLLNTLFSLSVVYDCEGNGETNEDDAINVKLDDVTDDRIYDGLTVLVPYLLDLRLECDDWFDLKWLIVLAGDRLHYLEGQVVYSS